MAAVRSMTTMRNRLTYVLAEERYAPKPPCTGKNMRVKEGPSGGDHPPPQLTLMTEETDDQH